MLILSGCGADPDPHWSGYVEGDYVYVASPIGGALTQLAVQRGAQVEAGALLFRLDAESERAASDEASASMNSAQAHATDLQSGKRQQEVAVTRAQLAQARAQATASDADLARQVQLVGQGFVSGARLDEANAAAREARARVAELEAALAVAQLPARTNERLAAAQSAEAARFALEQARWRQGQKVQRAPVAAQVADTFYRPGEWVNAGQPVVSLLPPDAMRVRFFVPESDLGAVRLGQAVSVSCDGCGRPVAAHISFIANQAEYTPPVIYSNSQRAKLVFMIEARPNEQDGRRLHPGQPVEVRAVAERSR